MADGPGPAGTPGDEGSRGRLRLRPLLIVLLLQFLLIGALLYAASRSFDFLGFLHPPPDKAARHVPVSSAHRFDAPAAMALVRRQLAFGPRPAGSPQLRRLGEELRPLLPAGRFEAVPGPRGSCLAPCCSGPASTPTPSTATRANWIASRHSMPSRPAKRMP